VSKKIVGSFALFLILALALTAAAQPPAQHLQLYRINVKSGSQAQFADYLTKVKEAADKTNAPQSWIVAQGVLGTSGTDYFVAISFDKWSEMDLWKQVPQMLTEAFGEAEAAKIQQMGGDSMWDFETTVFTLDAERSLNIDRSTAANYYQFLMGQVKPEMAQEYQSVVGALMEAQKKAGNQQMWIRRNASLGKSWQVYAAVPFDSWSERDSTGSFWDNVAKAVGAEEASRLRSRLLACYESREIFIIRRIPELSRAASESTNN
jgi:RNase P/RNase MRP subunit POP5